MSKIKSVIKDLLSNLDGRKKEVLTGRFGLDGKRPMTLQKIGDKYGVTRERIRQIESLALSEVRADLKDNFEVKEALDKVEDYINNKGGLVHEEMLVNDMAKILSPEADKSSLSFLREASGRFGYQNETEDFHSFWYTEKDSTKKAKELINKFATFIKSKREDVVSRNKFDELFATVVKSHKLPDAIGINYLAVSKKFCVSPYGDFGLSEWPEIKPATIRDWSYLVLKKANKPLHFEEIAQHISKIHNKKDKVFTPTVHNELIKDKRFVLVGRGVYGLTDFGYEQGTIKDLIKNILKKKGPMEAEEIIPLVSQQRMFKKNTVMLHLQDKKSFGKDGSGKYFATSA